MKPILSLLIMSITLLTIVPFAQAELVWFEKTNHFYKAVAEPDGITWEEAVAACEARSGYLATITTASESGRNFMDEFARKNG